MGYPQARLRRAYLSVHQTGESPEEALGRIAELCETSLEPILSLLISRKSPVRFVTLGVDVDLSNNGSAQLVATIEALTGTVLSWTGKSYPAGSYEEHELAHVTDLTSHLQLLNGTRYLVLGCHDLNFVQPRAKAKGLRGARAAAMLKAVKNFCPEVVLQHPHQTDTPGTWRAGWAKLKEIVKPLAYASGIAYFPQDGASLRRPIDKVREGTAMGNIVDYVWSRSGRVVVKALPLSNVLPLCQRKTSQPASITSPKLFDQHSALQRARKWQRT